jgi:hypothetical protein
MSKINYYTNYMLIDLIEEHTKIKLNQTDIAIISLVNRFNSQGQNCHMSRKNFTDHLRASKSTIYRSIKKLVKHNIITLYYPKNQAETNEACITHLHKDIKGLVSKCMQGPASTVNTQDKIIGDSESLLGDSSSDQERLNFLESLNKIK